MAGKHHSKKTKEILRQKNLGKIKTFAQKENLRKKRKPQSVETRRKRSISNTGKIRSAEIRANISKGKIGGTRIPCTLETKQRLSFSLKNKKVSLQTRYKISNWRKNQPAEFFARGERQGLSKLTAEQVIQIRFEYKNTNITQKELAVKYNIKQPEISDIIKRKTWKHIK